jgi:hypothetical protein
MIQSVRSEAGLAQMEMYTTNDNEGINSALQRVCGKKQPVSKFVEMIKDFIKSQKNQLLLAIVQQGNLALRMSINILRYLWINGLAGHQNNVSGIF